MSLAFWRTSHYYKTSVYYLNWLWNEIYLSISVLSRQFSQSKSVPRNDWIEMVEFPWQLMQPLQLGRHSCWNFTQTNYLQPFDKTFLFWVLIEIEQNQFEKLYSTSGIKCVIMISAFNTIVFMKSKTMNWGTFDEFDFKMNCLPKISTVQFVEDYPMFISNIWFTQNTVGI